MFTLRFDMRAPAFGARPTDLYAASVEMSAWAEGHGCLAAVVCEHHLAADRYLPAVTFVADDVDQAWDEIGRYLLHDAQMHAEWNPDNPTSAGISRADSVAELRETSTSHRILSVSEAAERGEAAIPRAASGAAAAGGDGFDHVLHELISNGRQSSD